MEVDAVLAAPDHGLSDQIVRNDIFQEKKPPAREVREAVGINPGFRKILIPSQTIQPFELIHPLALLFDQFRIICG